MQVQIIECAPGSNSERNTIDTLANLRDIQTIGYERGKIFFSTARRTGRSIGLAARPQVSNFSESSMYRMRKYLKNCVSDYRYMLTLTYPADYPHDGRVFKDHLRRMMQELRREVERYDRGIDKFSAFWFLEFQERGAPHFHIFLTHGFDMRWIAEKWFVICGSDDPKHLEAGTKIEKFRSEGNRRLVHLKYAVKYAEKSNQKVCPLHVINIGRFWGIFGNRATVAAVISFSSKTRKTKAMLDAMANIVTYARARAEDYYAKKAVYPVKQAELTKAMTAKQLDSIRMARFECEYGQVFYFFPIEGFMDQSLQMMFDDLRWACEEEDVEEFWEEDYESV